MPLREALSGAGAGYAVAVCIRERISPNIRKETILKLVFLTALLAINSMAGTINQAPVTDNQDMTDALTDASIAPDYDYDLNNTELCFLDFCGIHEQDPDLEYLGDPVIIPVVLPVVIDPVGPQQLVVQATPEPGSMALLALGVGLLLVFKPRLSTF